MEQLPPTAGLEHGPPYLVVDMVRAQFGKGFDALREYRAFVAERARSLDQDVGHAVPGH